MLELPHQRTDHGQHKPLPHIAEHHAEQHRIGNRHKRRDVEIVVGRRAVHIDIKRIRRDQEAQDFGKAGHTHRRLYL